MSRLRSSLPLLVLAAGPAVAATGAERVLEAGARVEGTAGAEPERFRIALAAGQFVHVDVEQAEADLVLEWTEPGGPEEESDLFEFAFAPEPLSLVAREDGELLVGVRAKHGGRARYRLVLDGPRTATEPDRLRAEAEGMLRAADRRRRVGEEQASRDACDLSNDAAEALVERSERGLAALALLRRAVARVHLSEYGDDAVVADLQRALALAREARLPAVEAAVQQARSMGHLYRGEAGPSFDGYSEALRLRRELGDRRAAAESLGGLAAALGNQGDFRAMVSKLEETLAIKKELGARDGTLVLFNLGRIRYELGQPQRALDALSEGLALARETRNTRDAARIASLMAEIYFLLGDPREAVRLEDLALPSWRQLGDRDGEAHSLLVTGDALVAMGDFERGLQHLGQALAVRKGIVGEVKGIGVVLEHMAAAERTRGARGRALELAEEAVRLMGDAAFSENTVAYILLGQLLREVGRLDDAARWQEKALSRAKEAGYIPGQASSLHEIARIDVARGDLPAALARLEDALALLDLERSDLASADLRALLGATGADVRADYVDVLVRLHAQRPGDGYPVRAFEATEAGRARSLSEAVASSGRDAGSESDRELLARARQARNRLAGALDEQVRLSTMPHGAAERAAQDQKVQELRTALREAQARVRQAAQDEASRHPRTALTAARSSATSSSRGPSSSSTRSASSAVPCSSSIANGSTSFPCPAAAPSSARRRRPTTRSRRRPVPGPGMPWPRPASCCCPTFVRATPSDSSSSPMARCRGYLSLRSSCRTARAC